MPPVFSFSTLKDAMYYRRRSAEQHRLYYTPRVWLVCNDSIVLNIYGEPGQPVSGTDGVTSIPSTRQLTSAASEFQTDGVQASDVLEVQDPACNSGDNGRYMIDSVPDEHTLVINEDWPQGSLSSLIFYVHFSKMRYTQFAEEVPFNVKLNPPQELLEKWGQSIKRDAMIQMSVQLCEDMNLTPKVGDRFVYPYGNKNIHFELQTLLEVDQLTDSGLPLHYIGFADKTKDKLP